MKTDPHRSLLQIENLCHLLGSQLFHIVEHEDNPQRRRDAQNSLVEEMVPLGVKQVGFGAVSSILEQYS